MITPTLQTVTYIKMLVSICNMIKLISRWILFGLWKAHILVKFVDKIKPNRVSYHHNLKVYNVVDVTMDYEIICSHYVLHPKIKELLGR